MTEEKDAGSNFSLLSKSTKRVVSGRQARKRVRKEVSLIDSELDAVNFSDLESELIDDGDLSHDDGSNTNETVPSSCFSSHIDDHSQTVSTDRVVFKSSFGDHVFSDSALSTTTESESDVDLLPLTVRLRRWYSRADANLSQLQKLLDELRPDHPELPVDARSIVGPPRKVSKKQLENGQYSHIGLEQGLLIRLQSGTIEENCVELSLDINIDGLDISRSSGLVVWPILCRSLQLTDSRPFVVGLFVGLGKPSPLEEYLKDYIQEVLSLMELGLNWERKKYNVSINTYICDTPARSYLKLVKSHCGYNACERCTQEGEYFANRVCFQCTKGNLRTDESFDAQLDDSHHNGVSPLAILGTKFVSQFPFCSMHLVYEGVAKRYLNYLIQKGPTGKRLRSADTNKVSDIMNELNEYIPTEFGRRPRSLNFCGKWKATEYRLFVLYLGAFVLKPVLPEEMYEHFMQLYIALRILCSEKLIVKEHYLQFAEELIESFVQYSSESVFGQKFISYNIHSLLHVVEDVRRHGVLDTFSAFPFENYLGYLKRKVRSGVKVLSQLVKRLAEVNYLYDFQERPSRSFVVCGSAHSGLKRKIRSIKNSTMRISVNARDSYFFSVDGIAHVKGINETNGELELVTDVYTQFDDYFTSPIESKDIGTEKFAVLEFPANVPGGKPMSCVVPLLWLIPNTKSCYWPDSSSFRTDFAVEKAVSRQTKPEKGWKIFPFNRVLRSYIKYEDAKAGQRRSEEKSEIDSGKEDIPRSKHGRPLKRVQPTEHGGEAETSSPKKPYFVNHPRLVVMKEPRNRLEYDADINASVQQHSVKNPSRSTSPPSTSLTGNSLKKEGRKQWAVQESKRELNNTPLNRQCGNSRSHRYDKGEPRALNIDTPATSTIAEALSKKKEEHKKISTKSKRGSGDMSSESQVGCRGHISNDTYSKPPAPTGSNETSMMKRAEHKQQVGTKSTIEMSQSTEDSALARREGYGIGGPDSRIPEGRMPPPTCSAAAASAQKEKKKQASASNPSSVQRNTSADSKAGRRVDVNTARDSQASKSKTLPSPSFTETFDGTRDNYKKQVATKSTHGPSHNSHETFSGRRISSADTLELLAGHRSCANSMSLSTEAHLNPVAKEVLQQRKDSDPCKSAGKSSCELYEPTGSDMRTEKSGDNRDTTSDYDVDSSDGSLYCSQDEHLDSGSNSSQSTSKDESDDRCIGSDINEGLDPMSPGNADGPLQDDHGDGGGLNNADHLNTDETDGEETPAPTPCAPKTTKDCFRKVFRYLANIKEGQLNQSVQINELLQRVRNKGVIMTRPENMPNIPLECIEDSESMEKILNENEGAIDYLVRKLAEEGGQSVKDTTDRILNKLMARNVGALYVLKGRKRAGVTAKRKFVGTKMYDVVKNAVMCVHKNANGSEIDKVIGDFLRYSPFRGQNLADIL